MTQEQHRQQHRQAVRDSIAKAAPGMLAWLDAVKAKFPTANLTGLSLQTDEGWAGMGVLAPKSSGTSDGR
jgi:hypothetical protein